MMSGSYIERKATGDLRTTTKESPEVTPRGGTIRAISRVARRVFFFFFFFQGKKRQRREFKSGIRAGWVAQDLRESPGSPTTRNREEGIFEQTEQARGMNDCRRMEECEMIDERKERGRGPREKRESEK